MSPALAMLAATAIVTATVPGRDVTASAVQVGDSSTEAARIPNPRPAAPRALSVYQVSLATDLSIIAASTLAIAGSYALTPVLITPHCPCDPNSVNRFDRFAIGHASPTASTLSNFGADLAVVLPVLANAAVLGLRQPLYDDVVVFAQALLVNGAVVSIVKTATQRPLPRVYAGQLAADNPYAYRSFYSGHTSTTFTALAATAYTLDARYGAGVWPWIVMVLVGSGVGAARIYAGYHFLTDVIVGAAAGTLFGTFVPALHAHARAAHTASWHIVPTGPGLALEHRW